MCWKELWAGVLMRGTFKWIGISFICLVVLLFAGVIVLLSKPDLVLTTKTLEWALNRYGAPYSPSWKNLQFQIHSSSFLHYQTSLSAEEFCFSIPESKMDGCANSVQISGELTLAIHPLFKFHLDRFDAELPQFNYDKYRDKIAVHLSEDRAIDLDVQNVSPPAHLSAQIKTSLIDNGNLNPIHMTFELDAINNLPIRGSLEETFIKASSGGYTSRSRLVIEPHRLPFLKLNASVEASPLFRNDAELVYEFDIKAQIEEFARVVQKLKNSRYAIPAPLNAMKGPIELQIGSREKASLKSIQHIVSHLTTDLSSAKQSLKTNVETLADIDLEKKTVDLDSHAALENVRLQLPYLEIGKVPNLGKDTRIHRFQNRSASAASPSYKVQWKAKIDTPNVPVFIDSNLTEDPVPIRMNLEMTPKKKDGEIRLQKFRVKFFRQTATVDHIRLTSGKDSSQMEIEGLVVYKLRDARINIQLSGLASSPRVDFSSDPPMERSQILAVLLYGKSPLDLDPDQTTAIANASNALSSGAFGLASLYLFASTPIEYVGYNPVSQTYSIRVRLPGGISAEVGSNFESSQYVSLRKRLGSHFALQTELERDLNARTVLSTFLEWFRRF